MCQELIDRGYVKLTTEEKIKLQKLFEPETYYGKTLEEVLEAKERLEKIDIYWVLEGEVWLPSFEMELLK